MKVESVEMNIQKINCMNETKKTNFCSKGIGPNRIVMSLREKDFEKDFGIFKLLMRFFKEKDFEIFKALKRFLKEKDFEPLIA